VGFSLVVEPYGRRVDGERGQSTVEWVALVLLASTALGALALVTPAIDGRSFGGFLAHRIVCVVKGGCRDGDDALARAYGERDGALARALAPNLVYEGGERSLPVDFRRCRERSCSDAPDDPDLDVHRTDGGEPATAFVRRIRRGGRLYLHSSSVIGPSDTVWNHSALRVLGGPYPGFHPDDWEAYAVRVDRDGTVWARASSHGHWQGCKRSRCRNRWAVRTGWTRVSRGSHAGHIPIERLHVPIGPDTAYAGPSPLRAHDRPLLPGRDLRERTTTAEGLRIVPLETLRRARRRYRPLDPGIRPPWRKRAYREPESAES